VLTCEQSNGGVVGIEFLLRHDAESEALLVVAAHSAAGHGDEVGERGLDDPQIERPHLRAKQYHHECPYDRHSK
jgi:hypothetical protein